MSHFGSTEWEADVGKGLIPGHSWLRKFGQNDVMASGALATIWDGGGDYVPPTQARLHDLSSDSANDDGLPLVNSGTATGGSAISLVDAGNDFTAGTPVVIGDTILDDTNTEIGFVTAITSATELAIARLMRSPNTGIPTAGFSAGRVYRITRNQTAGLGASILHLRGLNATFVDTQEFIVLNGVANVATANSYIRQYRARAFGNGTAGATGTLTSDAQIDGTTSLQIDNGKNQTLMAMYTIPAGFTGYINRWWARLALKKAAVVNMELRLGIKDGIGYISDSGAIQSAGSPIDTPLGYADILPAGADVWVQGTSDTADTSVAAGFRILLVQDGF